VVKISTLTGVSKKLILTPTDDFERFKISVEEVSADVEIARELEMQPENGLNCCTLMIKLLMDEQRKWFLEMESALGEDAANTVEMTTKDLEYYINLVDKAVARFERADSNFKRSSGVGKMLSNSTACYREIFCESKSQSSHQTSLLSHFKKLPQPP
jgi:hypothetical protein